MKISNGRDKFQYKQILQQMKSQKLQIQKMIQQPRTQYRYWVKCLLQRALQEKYMQAKIIIFCCGIIECQNQFNKYENSNLKLVEDPEQAAAIAWTVSGKAATISSDGRLTAVSAGKATITASYVSLKYDAKGKPKSSM